ncbi:MAG: flagellin hook IN motif-containing protein [Xanthobacteraceae bacterium]
MSIGSISFWQQDQSYWNQSQSFGQQDQNYWNQQVAQSQASTADDALITAMGSVVTNKTTGLASIANQEALTRVNNQIAADEKALLAASGSSSSGSSSPSGPAPATATGKVPLTTSTLLSTLRIPPNGTITVSDGTNTTEYSSTGTDTVADLIGAINANVAGNAYVTASLNSHGNLVITGKDQTESVTVGGTFASDVGFGPGHQTFQPTAGSPSASTSSSSSSSSTASSSSATSSSTGSSSKTSSSTSKSASKSTTAVSSLASENASTAASFLSASGASGSLVDMLV